VNGELLTVRILCCVWLALCASCSLLDLSSRIHQDPCSSDSDCFVLNDAATPCVWYSCSARGFCEEGPTDADHDGYVAAQCERDPKLQDCDDNSASRHPGNTEVCDNADNDCDSYVDEGVLEQEQSLALSFADAAPASNISYALDLNRTLLAVGVLIGTSPSVAAVNTIDFEDTAAAEPKAVSLSGPTPLPLHAETFGVGLPPLADAALAAYSSDPPAHMVAGSLVSISNTLSQSPSIAKYGLHCASDEACAANASNPDQPIATPYSDASTLSPGSDGTLVVYRRNPEHSAALCESQDTPTAQPLLANLLSRATVGLGEPTSSATQVGLSAQASAPAIMALPGTTTNGVAFGWLVVYPDADGALQVARVWFDGSALRVAASLLRMASEDGPLLAPQLVYARALDFEQDHPLLGLVAQRGCGDAGRVVFAQLEAMLKDDGSVTLSMHTPLTELGGDVQQRAPSLAYRPGNHTAAGDRRCWGVAYRDATGVRARLVAETGLPLGDAPYTLMNTAAISGTPAEATAIAPLMDQLRWFAVYAYAPVEMPSGGLLRSALGCTVAQ